MVTITGVTETSKTVIGEITHGTDFKLVNLWLADNANLTHGDLNPSLDEPENRWNIHLVLYDTLLSRAKPSSNGWLSHCACSFGSFDESHRYKTKNSMGGRIVTNARIGFQLQVTAMLGFHSLYDCCYQMMWMFSGVAEDSENDAVMEKHSADALDSAVKRLMHAIRTEDKDTQLDAAHRTIQIAKPWTIRRWRE